jgi:hypothetical protein
MSIRLKKITVDATSLLVQRGAVHVTHTDAAINKTSGALIVDGGISINCTHLATSSTSGGALVVGGGVSIFKNAYIEGNIEQSGAASTFDIKGDANSRLFVGPIGTPFVSIAPDGVTNQVTLDNVSATINSALVVNGQVSLFSTTNATSTAQGAFIAAGGIAIAKDIRSGGLLYNNGIITEYVTLGTGMIGATASGIILSGQDIHIQSSTTRFTNEGVDVLVLSSTGTIMTSAQMDNALVHDSIVVDSTSGVLYVAGATIGVLSSDAVWLGNNVSITSSMGSLEYSASNGSHIMYAATTPVFSVSTGSIKIHGEQGYSLASGSALRIQGDSLASSSAVELYTQDGDSTDDNHLRIYGLGTPSSQTNTEDISIGWESPAFRIKTRANGSGVQRALALSVDTTEIVVSTGTVLVDALELNASGTVHVMSTVASALVVDGGAQIAGDTILSGSLSIKDIFIDSSGPNISISSSGPVGVGVIGNALRLYHLGDPDAADTETLDILTGDTFQIKSSSSGTGEIHPLNIQERLYISEDGVGINTSQPAAHFHVSGGSILESASIGSLALGNTSITVFSTIDSMSPTSGSITTFGGLGVAKNLNVGQSATIGKLFVTGPSTFAYVSSSSLITNNITSGTLNVGGIVATGMIVQGTQDSVSTTSGSITTFGGLGAAKSLYIGGTSHFDNKSIYTVNGQVLEFKDLLGITRFSVSKAAGSHDLSISRHDATGTLIDNPFEIVNTTGNIVLKGFVSGNALVQTTTASINISSGALVVNGGVGIAGDVYIGKQVNILDTSNSVDINSGSLVLEGGLGVAKNANIGGDLVITGNLFVNGTTTSIDSTTVSIADNIIEINAGPAGSKNAGILIERFQTSNDGGNGDIVSDTRFIDDTLPSQTGMSATEIKLSISKSSVNEFYTGFWIKVTSGFSNNQVRKVTAYDGATRTATIALPWTSQNPSINDTVHLYDKAFVGSVYNETLDILEFGSTVAIDVPLTNGISTSMWSVSCLSTQSASNSSSGSIVALGGIGIQCTENATANTSGGAMTIAGGAAVAKDLYIGGSLSVNGADITPNPSDIIKSTTVTAANNQTSFTSVPQLAFDSSVYGADVYLATRLIADTNLYSNFHFRLVNKETSWEIIKSYVGDSTGLDFDVNTSGQLLYKSPLYAGFVSLEFKYRAFVNE